MILKAEINLGNVLKIELSLPFEWDWALVRAIVDEKRLSHLSQSFSILFSLKIHWEIMLQKSGTFMIKTEIYCKLVSPFPS